MSTLYNLFLLPPFYPRNDARSWSVLTFAFAFVLSLSLSSLRPRDGRLWAQPGLVRTDLDLEKISRTLGRCEDVSPAVAFERPASGLGRPGRLFHGRDRQMMIGIFFCCWEALRD